MTGEKKKMVQKVGMKIKRANVTSYLEFKPFVALSFLKKELIHLSLHKPVRLRKLLPIEDRQVIDVDIMSFAF